MSKKASAKKVASGPAPKAAASKKTAAPKKKGTPKKKAARASVNDVTIRMYCQGLGDCFLLTFPGEERPVRVLIDCGVIIGTADAAKKMQQVVADIATETAGHIDLLVVTHEHWDHISGFVQARELFEQQLKFDHVWLAWTENSRDQRARELRKQRDQRVETTRRSLAQLQGMLKSASLASAEEGDDSSAMDALSEVSAARQVLSFFGPEPAGVTLAADGGVIDPAAKSGSTSDAMNWVNSRATRFCEPGEQLALPGSAVRVYVLGPPRDERIFKDAPRKGKDEAYEFKANRLSFDAALENRLSGMGLQPNDSPFEWQYQISTEEARTDGFFREHYGFEDDPLGASAPAWQRIEYAWLEGANRLALKLDSDTNNTSLALAFELTDGRTLIFPGDAQIGNWQSWGDVEFHDERQQPLTVTSQDLLGRAVLYKVGHHGSHNATLKSGGLEAMTSGRLSAMIPVNEVMAHSKRPPKTGWKMPFDPLYAELLRRTGGQVLRADHNASALDALGEGVETAAKSSWQAFRKRVRFSSTRLVGASDTAANPQPLYVEYTLE